jgi:hypothetical protein
MKKSLPHKLYVKHVRDARDGTEWFEASEDFEDLADPGDVITIGVYTRFGTEQIDGRARIAKEK